MSEGVIEVEAEVGAKAKVEVEEGVTRSQKCLTGPLCGVSFCSRLCGATYTISF